MRNGYFLNLQFYYDTFNNATWKEARNTWERIKIRTNIDIFKLDIFTLCNKIKEKLILKLSKSIYVNINQLFGST